jgi:hypothetical protein
MVPSFFVYSGTQKKATTKRESPNSIRGFPLTGTRITERDIGSQQFLRDPVFMEGSNIKVGRIMQTPITQLLEKIAIFTH